MASGFKKETCPYCGNSDCEAEWTDVGVGFVQTGPYHCYVCDATEIGPYDKSALNEVEKKVGWYQPGSLPDSVSSVNGLFIDSETALALYRQGVVSHVPFKLQTPSMEFMRALDLKQVEVA